MSIDPARLLSSFAAAAALAAAGSGAEAIVPNPAPRVCTEYGASDYVFVADVVGYRRLRETVRTIDDEHVWSVRVRRRFKGDPPTRFAVYTPANSAAEFLDVGRRYILFARRRNGRAIIYGGGNIRSGTEIAAIVAQLRALRAVRPRLASLRGRLDREDLSPAQFVRVALTRRDGLRRLVRSDAAGWFEALVPPGRWRARVVEPGWTGQTGVYSFQDIERIDLPAGGCADLQIEATPLTR